MKKNNQNAQLYYIYYKLVKLKIILLFFLLSAKNITLTFFLSELKNIVDFCGGVCYNIKVVRTGNKIEGQTKEKSRDGAAR